MSKIPMLFMFQAGYQTPPTLTLHFLAYFKEKHTLGVKYYSCFKFIFEEYVNLKELGPYKLDFQGYTDKVLSDNELFAVNLDTGFRL